MKPQSEILMMRGHWEQIAPDGTVTIRTDDADKPAALVCTLLASNARVLFGDKRPRPDYSTLTYTHKPTGYVIRFVGKYI